MSYPDDFKNVINDFLRDIATTFPEYETILASECRDYEALYTYCKTVYPARFFDILYKNEKMFNRELIGTTDDVNTQFLPKVEFKELWNSDISEGTKDAIWKYLQLILFSVVSNVSDIGSFGDTAKLFEAIDEGELKTKLEEVIEGMNGMFSNDGDDGGNEGLGQGQGQGQGTEEEEEAFKKASEFMKGFMNSQPGDETAGSHAKMPNPEGIQQHLNSLLNGKIGSLAKEIAEETAKDLDLDMTSESSVKGIFQTLFKNPGKLSGLVKSVGEKLDKKLKSGELKESEIMQEASDLMSKMKNMPGMGNIASMLSQMGMNVPGGGKVNVGAMQSQLQRNIKQAKMRERMMKKLNEKAPGPGPGPGPGQSQVFSTGETVERTPRFPKPAHQPTMQTTQDHPIALTEKDFEDDEKTQAKSKKKKNNKK